MLFEAWAYRCLLYSDVCRLSNNHLLFCCICCITNTRWFFLISTRHYFSYNYKGFSAGVNPVWMLQRLCEAAPIIALLNNNINIITIKRFQTTAYCGIKRLHRPLLHLGRFHAGKKNVCWKRGTEKRSRAPAGQLCSSCIFQVTDNNARSP